MQTETLSDLSQNPPLLGEPGPLKCACVCSHAYVYLYKYPYLQVERESHFFAPLLHSIYQKQLETHSYEQNPQLSGQFHMGLSVS